MPDQLSAEPDVIVVGMGWAGSVVAAELVAAGLSVVGFERGRYRDAKDAIFTRAHDELRFGTRKELAQDVGVETWTFRHHMREDALPVRYIGSFRPGEGVGGSGVPWGGNCWRFVADDFDWVTKMTERYGRDALPADSTSQDWGIAWDDIEPHYDRFERLIGVSGKAGNLRGTLQEGGNPFESPRANEYPVRPFPESTTARMYKEAVRELGYSPFPNPIAILSEPYGSSNGVERRPCTFCGTCGYHPCQVQ